MAPSVKTNHSWLSTRSSHEIAHWREGLNSLKARWDIYTAVHWIAYSRPWSGRSFASKSKSKPIPVSMMNSSIVSYRPWLSHIPEIATMFTDVHRIICYRQVGRSFASKTRSKPVSMIAKSKATSCTAHPAN